MKKLVVVGAGGHAKVVIDAVRQQGEFQIVALIDEAKTGQSLAGIGIVSRFEIAEPVWFVIAIGNNAVRRDRFKECLVRGWQPATIIHPSAILAPDVSIGGGTVVFAGAVVNTATAIGQNCIINTAASVDHDCTIGDHAHIAPGCHLAGQVSVGEGSFLGIGTVAIPLINFGNWSVAGAGAVLIRDVPDNARVVGVPARPLP